MALSIYRTQEEAASAIRELAKAVARYAGALKSRIAWTEKHEESYNMLTEKL